MSASRSSARARIRLDARASPPNKKILLVNIVWIADSGLDARVEGQQPRTPTSPTSALEHSPRRPAEERVPGSKAAEKDREHGRSSLAMGSEQRGQVFLPGHLVDETRKSGQHREQQRDQANHCSGSTSIIGQAQSPANIARGQRRRLRCSVGQRRG